MTLPAFIATAVALCLAAGAGYSVGWHAARRQARQRLLDATHATCSAHWRDWEGRIGRLASGRVAAAPHREMASRR